MPIPWDMLSTAHKERQIIVKTKGIQANCPNLNCDYSIMPKNETPFVVYSEFDYTECIYNVSI